MRKCHIYIHIYMNVIEPLKKKEILPFVTTWMDFEAIMLSEMSQTEKDKYQIVSLICGIFFLKKKPNSQKQRLEWSLPGAGGWRN